MTDNTRPRPRPRPKPKAVVPLVSSPQPSSSTAEISPALGQIEEDEDAYFMRNQSRTSKDWKRLNQISKEAKAKNTRPENDGSSDDLQILDEPSPRLRKRNKKKSEGDSWRRAQQMTRLLSEDLEDDVLIQDIENTPKGSQTPAGGKRKRNARSRSRSITPPPALPLHQLQNARNVVRQTLDSAPRPPSPGLGDELPDVISPDLAPELAKIAHAVRTHASQPSSSNRLPELSGPENVTIKVKWKPHPLNEVGRAHVWGFKMKRHDTFKDLFEQTADEASILSDHLIVTYNGKRVFASATPHHLKIWAEAELEACDKYTHEHIRTRRHDVPDHPSSLSNPNTVKHSDDEDSAAESDSGDKLKLIIRSAVTTKDITLTVKPTTKCGAIVKAFIKAAKLTVSATPKKGNKQSEPMLVVEGERMDPESEIGNADVEDGDMVEIVGV